MPPPRIREVCPKCAQSVGGKAYNANFFYCDDGVQQNWPTVQTGLPYANSGDSFVGMQNYFGDSAMSSDGTILNTTSSVNSFSVTKIPCTAIGNFSAKMEVRPNGTNARRIGFVLFDNDVEQSFYINASNASPTSSTLELSTICDLFSVIGDTVQSSQTFPGLTPSQWTTLEIRRTGRVLTLIMNGESYLFDVRTSTGVNLGIGYVSDGITFSIRNIEVANI